MCSKEAWTKANKSPAYYAAKRLEIELKEVAKEKGYQNTKSIRVKNKEQIIKGGLGKADAILTWEEGPENWTDALLLDTAQVYYQTDAQSVSFYNINNE